MLQVAQQVTKGSGKSIAESYVSMIESGRRNPPRQPVLGAFAKALGEGEVVLEYAAKGQRYRPIIEVLKERNVSQELIWALRAHERYQMDYVTDVLRALSPLRGVELLIILGIEGTVEMFFIDDLL